MLTDGRTLLPPTPCPSSTLGFRLLKYVLYYMTARGARARSSSAQAMDDMVPPGSSSSSRVELAALIARCVALAEGAGALIREVYHQSGAVAVTYKGGGSSDPVTTADWRAQRHIAGSLALAYPGLLVIGEEDEEAVAAQDDVPLTV